MQRLYGNIKTIGLILLFKDRFDVRFGCGNGNEIEMLFRFYIGKNILPVYSPVHHMVICLLVCYPRPSHTYFIIYLSQEVKKSSTVYVITLEKGVKIYTIKSKGQEQTQNTVLGESLGRLSPCPEQRLISHRLKNLMLTAVYADVEAYKQRRVLWWYAE